MPISYRIDVPRRIVRTTYSGTPSTPDFRQYFIRVEADPNYDASFARLIDWRDLSAAPMTADVELLAYLTASSAGGAKAGRRAMLVRPGVQYGVGRMLQALIRMRGCEVAFELFNERSAAEAWLCSESASIAAA
jgi:hypothetical protein